MVNTMSLLAVEYKLYLCTVGSRNVIDGRGYTICCNMTELGILLFLGSS
jgi:hypothetical protein